MANPVALATPAGDGCNGGAATSSAVAAAAIKPAFVPNAHCSPAAKHHSATTITNPTSCKEVNALSATAAPIIIDTAITRRAEPCGLSCNAVAPAIAAAPAA